MDLPQFESFIGSGGLALTRINDFTFASARATTAFSFFSTLLCFWRLAYTLEAAHTGAHVLYFRLALLKPEFFAPCPRPAAD